MTIANKWLCRGRFLFHMGGVCLELEACLSTVNPVVRRLRRLSLLLMRCLPSGAEGSGLYLEGGTSIPLAALLLAYLLFLFFCEFFDPLIKLFVSQDQKATLSHPDLGFLPARWHWHFLPTESPGLMAAFLSPMSVKSMPSWRTGERDIMEVYNDTPHPHHSASQLLPSGRRLKAPLIQKIGYKIMPFPTKFCK